MNRQPRAIDLKTQHLSEYKLLNESSRPNQNSVYIYVCVRACACVFT